MIIYWFLEYFFSNPTQPPDAAVHGSSVKVCSKKFNENQKKTLVSDSLFEYTSKPRPAAC